MKLTKLQALTEGTGEQTAAFSDYMEELMQYAPDSFEPRLLRAGSHAIKQGMIFTTFGGSNRPAFKKGTITVLFPSKAGTQKDFNLVNISSSGGHFGGENVTLAKFCSISIDEIEAAYTKILEAHRDLAKLLR